MGTQVSEIIDDRRVKRLGRRQRRYRRSQRRQGLRPAQYFVESLGTHYGQFRSVVALSQCGYQRRIIAEQSQQLDRRL